MNEDIKPQKTLDCIGLYCPQPLLQTRLAFDSMEPGQVLEVLADDPAAEEDLTRFAKRTGNEILMLEKKDNKLRFLIRKVE
jgi:tRNA 2-thiouridine synthesizing protein A